MLPGTTRKFALVLFLAFLPVCLTSCSNSNSIKLHGTIKSRHWSPTIVRVVKVNKVLEGPDIDGEVIELHGASTLGECENKCLVPTAKEEYGELEKEVCKFREYMDLLEKGVNVEVKGEFVNPEAQEPYINLCPKDSYYIKKLP